MKKFLSFMLVLAMIASMMCINVAAAETKTHLVGTRDENNSIDDGVASNANTFSKENESVVSVAIDGSVHNRYAVDLLYTSMAITIISNATWNVETLQYDGEMSIKVGENANPQSLTNNTPVEGVGIFKITNYSDADVEVAVTVQNTSALYDEDAPNAAIATTTKVYETTAGSTNAGVEVTDSARSTIAGVTPVINGGGSPVVATYRADLDCADWAANFGTLSGQAVNVAKITFTVSAASTAQDPTQGN